MDDNYFNDDDDLDDLPSNTLQEIESKAFEATQKPLAAAEQPPSSDYGLEDDEEVIDLDAHPRAAVLTARPVYTNQTVDEVTQREQWRQQRYGVAAQHRLPAFRPPRPTSSASHAEQLAASQTEPLQEIRPLHSQDPQIIRPQEARSDDPAAPDVAALQAKIEELQRHQSALLQENQDTKAQAFAKAGEISIVRANQEKAAKEYENKLAVLQELHAQEQAKHKVEIEAARKDRELVETSNKFLEHDLAQEADRARQAKKALRGGNDSSKPRPSPASTPKKKSSLPYRDGFNDEEVIAISPSKSKEKSRASTPKPVSKRKRAEQDASPAKQLSFSDQHTLNMLDEGSPLSHSNIQFPIRSKEVQKKDQRMDIFQIVLEHRQADNARTIELLTKHCLPSVPEKTLSSFIYDALHAVHTDAQSSDHHVRFCQKLLELWSKCLDEQVASAVPLVISLLQHVLINSEDSTSAVLAASLAPLVVQTADLVATAKARAWTNPTANKGPSPEIQAIIRPLDCLDLLQLLMMNCLDDSEAMTGLWSSIEHDFILVMLHKAQPLSESILVLRLLGLSVLRDTFGAITRTSTSGEEYATKQRQRQNEYNLVSRLANLLVDRRDQQRFVQPPGTDSHREHTTGDGGPQDHDVGSDDFENGTVGFSLRAPSVLDLRLASLNLLTHLCSTAHGGRLLASHRFATGRIIRLLHESILSMYKYNVDTHQSTTACVNKSVMLLANLCFVHSEVLDLRTRLAAEQSGHHKYLVALSRVAFSTGESMIEEGIWSESAEAAHRMLDEFLSPEEGDAVMSVFSSVRSAS